MTRIARIATVLAVMAAMSASAHAGARPVGRPAVNVNTATVTQLQFLPGIGPKLANAIHDFAKCRPISSANDLLKVKGIGPKTLDRIAPFVVVTGPTTATRKITINTRPRR